MRRERLPKPNYRGPSTTGLARVLSKLGFCSRSQGRSLILAGRVQVDGAVIRDPEKSIDINRARIEVDGRRVCEQARIYLMLNKPRGLVTTASDEQGRGTVFACLEGKGLPFVAPVGRLDQASEGLLLFTNDTTWAARLTDPGNHIDKIYHVQITALADEVLIARLERGIMADSEFLSAKRVVILRQGEKNSWLEIVLDEGRNRHIRRLMKACGIGVLRLIRIAIGDLKLGNLGKGQFRFLSPDEVSMLGS